MVKVYGNATTGYTAPITTLDIPRPSDGVRPAHRPWCRDCKRKHDPDQLDNSSRCTRCAPLAIARAAAAEQRAQAEAATAAAKKATATKPPSMPKHSPKAPPAAPAAAPPRPAPKTHKPPTQTTESLLNSQIQHATRILTETHSATHAATITLRRNALAALDALQAVHALTTQTPATATSTPAAADPSTSSAPSPALAVHPHTSAAGTGLGKPTRQPTLTQPRQPRPNKTTLPADQVTAAYRAGQTLAQIAATYGVSAPTVRRTLIEHGTPRRRTPVTHSPELIEQVRHLYEDMHCSQAEIATRLGHSTKVIQTLMANAGIDRRPAKARNAANNARGLKAQIGDLGVTTADIRAWATQQGLTVSTRGLPTQQLVDAYTAAHPNRNAS